MFELGFGELLLIAVIALVVLGPERLPVVARRVGLWVGRIQNFIANAKMELTQQAGMTQFKETKESIEQAVQQLRQEFKGNIDEVNQRIHSSSTALPSSEHAYDVQQDTIEAKEGENPGYHRVFNPVHQVSLRQQSLLRKRDVRPRGRPMPKLRVRRHH